MQTLTNKGEMMFVRFAISLKRQIGKHVKMIGNSEYSEAEYQAAEFQSGEAERLVKHIVKTVENRHIAVIVAKYSGCPGFINYR